MYAQTEDYLQQKSDSKRTVSSENLLTEEWKTPDHVKVYVLNAFPIKHVHERRSANQASWVRTRPGYIIDGTYSLVWWLHDIDDYSPRTSDSNRAVVSKWHQYKVIHTCILVVNTTELHYRMYVHVTSIVLYCESLQGSHNISVKTVWPEVRYL